MTVHLVELVDDDGSRSRHAYFVAPDGEAFVIEHTDDDGWICRCPDDCSHGTGLNESGAST